MRVLLSTIGSRGDVEPLVALAIQLKELNQAVRLCAPPDFRDLVEGFGISFVPIGPEVRGAGRATGRGAPPTITPEQRRQLVEAMVANQFATITEASQECDVLVAGAALQVATRSVAETQGLRYVYASYTPATLPSSHHAPPPLTMLGQKPVRGLDEDRNRALWEQDVQRWNDTFGAALNSCRKSAGLPAVSDVRSHMFTNQPWLAADATLAPWLDSGDLHVIQTGAWIRRDTRPFDQDLEAFLETGDPPIYFGFGSAHVARELGEATIQAARALSRRAIVSSGWADLSLVDGERDCLSIGEVNQQSLFRRVSCVVHHGGAGTTTLATLAGTPQVIIPQLYDQFYMADRIEHLGIGYAHAPAEPTTDSLTTALTRALRPEVVSRAQSVSREVRKDGALDAARRLMALA
jgi:vancomycin aglycone glucosyltransferase